MIDDGFEEEKGLPIAKIAIALVLIVLLGGIALYAVNPTAFASLPFANSLNNGSGSQLLNLGIGSGNSTAGSEIVFREIQIDSDFNSKEFDLPLQNATLNVEGTLAVEEPEKEKARLNGNIELKNFNGIISRKNSKTTMAGSMDSVNSENASINYLEKKSLVLEVNGNISIEKNLLESFDANIAGRISMPEISLDFANAKISLKNFNGTIELNGDNVKLNGIVEELKANTGNANVQIN